MTDSFKSFKAEIVALLACGGILWTALLPPGAELLAAVLEFFAIIVALLARVLFVKIPWKSAAEWIAGGVAAAALIWAVLALPGYMQLQNALMANCEGLAMVEEGIPVIIGTEFTPEGAVLANKSPCELLASINQLDQRSLIWTGASLADAEDQLVRGYLWLALKFALAIVLAYEVWRSLTPPGAPEPEADT